MRTLFLLVGPTCTGKSTLEKALNAEGIPSVCSFTTRTPRTGEVHGKDYYFVDKAAVLDKLNTRAVAQHVFFRGNYYGTTLQGLDEAFAVSDTAVVVVEPTGVTQFQAFAAANPDLGIKVVSVYINNAPAILLDRLIARFKGDENADPAYYWERAMGMVTEQAEWNRWPSIKWDIYFACMDNEIKYRTVADTVQTIMQNRAQK